MTRVLLDDGVPRQLAKALCRSGFEAIAFANVWEGLDDAALLDLAERESFNVLITGDKNMPFQQNIAKRQLAMLVLSGVDRRQLPHYSIFIADALRQLAPGSFSYLGKDGRLTAGRLS